ncbi:MAG TPA: glycosyltransferase family 1 protein [Bacteroidales bacterium]|nr:glycosyltransferase family 1 protein [Bacteroidales bacterium]
MNKELNIITLDIPFPPNYGGAIDEFYTIKKLYDLGIKIYLHAFQYCERKPSKELEQYCTEVHYYERKRNLYDFFNKIPFIVKTRDHDLLLNNLLKNNAPILFEGIHTTYFLSDPALKGRLKIIRAHNIEQDYYKFLAKFEKNLLKKIYFFIESVKLKNYEINVIKNADSIAAISIGDMKRIKLWNENVELISSFHPFDNVESMIGKGKYALFHGNLDVSENKTAAEFLANKVFNDINIPFIIAGKCKKENNIKRHLVPNSNIQLLTNISDEKMNDLIRNAHLNVLYTTQSTGLKLKLIFSIFLGRFILVNNLMVENTDLAPLCEIANDEKEMKKKILNIFDDYFTDEMIEKRKKILNDLGYMNEQNVKKLLKMLQINE